MNVRCPHCDALIEMHRTDYGKMRQCPQCDEPFEVPFPKATQARRPPDSTNFVVGAVTFFVLGVIGVLAGVFFGIILPHYKPGPPVTKPATSRPG